MRLRRAAVGVALLVGVACTPRRRWRCRKAAPVLPALVVAQTLLERFEIGQRL